MRGLGGRGGGGGAGAGPGADLKRWCAKMTEGYPGVNIANFHTSWRDGLAFCALVHKYAPDSLDFNSLDPANIESNNQLAFDLAEKLFNVPKLLDAEDMLMAKPEQFSIMTYLLQFYKAVGDKKPVAVSGLGANVNKPEAKPGAPATEVRRPAGKPAPAAAATAETAEPAAPLTGSTRVRSTTTASPAKAAAAAASPVKPAPSAPKIITPAPTPTTVVQTPEPNLNIATPAAIAVPPEEDEDDDQEDIAMTAAVKTLISVYTDERGNTAKLEDAIQELDKAHQRFQSDGRSAARTTVPEDQDILFPAFDGVSGIVDNLKTDIRDGKPTVEQLQSMLEEVLIIIDDIMDVLLGGDLGLDFGDELEEVEITELDNLTFEEMEDKMNEALDVADFLATQLDEASSTIEALQKKTADQEQEILSLKDENASKSSAAASAPTPTSAAKTDDTSHQELQAALEKLEKAQNEKKEALAEKSKAEEESRVAREEQSKAEADKKKAEEEKLKMEGDLAKAHEERLRAEEEKEQSLNELQQVEEEKQELLKLVQLYKSRFEAISAILAK